MGKLKKENKKMEGKLEKYKGKIQKMIGNFLKNKGKKKAGGIGKIKGNPKNNGEMAKFKEKL